MLRRLIWFGGAGAVAGILTLSFSGAVSSSGIVISYLFSGVFFAVILTAVAAAQNLHSSWDYGRVIRYCSAALVLALGAPCGFLMSAGIQRLLGMRQAVGGPISFLLSFILPAITAIVLWGLCLAVFPAVVMGQWRTKWLLEAVVIVILVFVFVEGVDSIARGLWSKSLFVPLFVVGEEVASAVFLAIATRSGNVIGKLATS